MAFRTPQYSYILLVSTLLSGIISCSAAMLTNIPQHSAPGTPSHHLALAFFTTLPFSVTLPKPN
ncbi:hypothetical protein E2C01_034873 [Portunus trituberculatus]|uniref:Uncharacterized protein n=1 Tax=Portunus trituberculatus TaxID=210409 RepID=A0A5B7F7I9_PORTR|nr:hypothetical protein [Portunus trituberculatus]